MIELELPWPPSSLSPNNRLHWSKLSKAKRDFRRTCWIYTLEARLGPVPAGDLHLELLFMPPDARSYDRDNLVARFKAGIDGLCDGLKINDARFKSVTCYVAAPIKGGHVTVRIKGEDNGITE